MTLIQFGAIFITIWSRYYNLEQFLLQFGAGITFWSNYYNLEHYKVAFVTGSTTGIGLGISLHLAGLGCSVIITGPESHGEVCQVLEEFKRYKVQVDYIPADLTDTSAVNTLCEKVSQLYPDGVDILVNNAGIQYVSPVEDYPLEKWNEMMAVTLTAPFLLIKHFVPFMKRKGWGRIINMASQMAVISTPGKAPYSTAKAGLVGLTKGVALECAEFGVTVNALCPGYVDAPMAVRQAQDISREKGMTYEEAKNRFTNKTGKWVTIDEISGIVQFLCSPAAANITGSAMLVDGGNVAS